MTMTPTERAKKLMGRKPPPEPTVDERMRQAINEVAEEQQWPSVSLGPDGYVVPGPLPDGVPPPPTLERSTPELATAKAKVSKLAGQFEAFETEMAAALESVDADRVLALRREHEEVSVRLWAAQRDAVELERAHCGSEQVRLVGYLPAYSEPLDKVRVELRELQVKERSLRSAMDAVGSTLERLATVMEKLDQKQRLLAQGPDVNMAKKEGWGK